MTVAPRKAVIAALACGGCCLWGLALGQDGDASAAGQPDASAAFDEEVIVRGRPLDSIRDLIREAEEVYYNRFNEINSDDQFDIYCRYRVELGSRAKRRTCLPNFWREADEHIGEETARGMQGFQTLNTQAYASEQHRKSQLLADEMLQLTTEDEEMLRAVQRLANLQQSLEDSKGIQRAARSTAEREVVAGDAGLAYDADAVFQVRVGRKAWTHELTRRTFTIARIFGEIRDLEVECDERDAKLEHEPGIEWTLPESWGACTLVVDATRDTTFALYEFDRL